jgi:hypothetical protein
MMKVAGVFSKQAREPIRCTVSVKGNRMLQACGERTEIIDVDAETFTEINLPRKTYSVVTFAEMKQAMEQAMKKASGEQQADMEFKVSVNQTGQTREIGGFNTRQSIVTLEIETTDPESGQKGSMRVISDMWLAPKVAGYEEATAFQQKMAEKLNFAPGGNPMLADPQIAKGMAGLYKESGKLDGVPVFQTISMGPKVEGAEGTQAGPPASPPPQREEKAEAPSAGNVLGGALGGKLGGFGRFGRRKQPRQEPKQEAALPAETAPAPASGGTPGALIEMTSEMTGFSSSAVPDSDFAVPAGFKKVNSEHLRQMR